MIQNSFQTSKIVSTNLDLKVKNMLITQISIIYQIRILSFFNRAQSYAYTPPSPPPIQTLNNM